MALGERLKQARLEKGLSQRQLCGEEITRNMLSQIENGSATPSVATLQMLALRLGKPVSFFLEEDVVMSANQQVIMAARQAFFQQDYGEIPALLKDYRSPDGMFDWEKYFMEALSLIALARQALDQGKTLYAQDLLEQAKQAGERTPYYTAATERQRLLALYQLRPEMAAELEKQLPEDGREQLLRAQVALTAKEYSRCVHILDGNPDPTPRWQLLRGQAAMGMKDYSLAAECFLRAEGAYPVDCAKALEECYREMGDYKNAYLYACKQKNPNA